MKLFKALFQILFSFILAMETAMAAGYPQRPVTIVVPGPAGGSGDIVSRLVGKALSDIWKQPVVIENRPGAGGIIGVQALLRSAPDGYTLLMGNTGPNAINYSLSKSLPYKAQDLIAISDVLVFPNVLVVKADAPYRSVSDLIAAGKKNPGKLSFSSSGIGQTTHLSGELFKVHTGVDATHIPYKGANLGLSAVMSGEVDFMFDNLPTSQAQIKAGTVRALAVTSSERIADMPEVPTMIEAGVADFQITGWFGLFALKGTPTEVVEAVHRSLAEILRQPETVARFKQLGGHPGGLTPRQFSDFVESEGKKWALAVNASGANAVP